jgi:predicted O-linked N-acetylglucosamine transferase (SPINDLY family)
MTNSQAKLFGQLLSLPVVFEDELHINRELERFDSQLEALSKKNMRFSDPWAAWTQQLPHFMLPYLGENTVNRNKLVAKILRSASIPEISYISPHLQTNYGIKQLDRVKVVFVSTFLRRHSVTKMLAGVLKVLDKFKFEIFLFHFGRIKDEFTDMLVELGSAKLVFMNFEHFSLKQCQVCIICDVFLH